MPRDYIPDEKMQSFQQFRIESKKGVVVKDEEKEEEKGKYSSSYY